MRAGRKQETDPLPRRASPYTGMVMEIDGHPTQDLIEELQRRGALRVEGSSAGPRSDALQFVAGRIGEGPGFWLFLPYQAFLTGVDDLPG